MKNPYLPMPVELIDIITEVETKDIKTFRMKFLNEQDEKNFNYLPGQFGEVSVAGKGESPFGMASSPTQKGYIEFTVMKMGVVTQHLHNMEVGQRLGVRGPLGNHYPLDLLKGKNVVIIGGGFAFTTLRSLINYMIFEENRKDFGDITVIYGARNPGLLIYKNELQEWEKRPDLNLNVTVDKGDEGWTGREGFVPTVTKEVAPSSENTIAIICGPPIMIRFTLPVVYELGFTPENVYTSLENRMKCGIGKCGRCNVGRFFVCKDGPVFSYAQLKELPQEF
jgi:sulfhydrogenase subunit gamma (sulfur reductase)